MWNQRSSKISGLGHHDNQTKTIIIFLLKKWSKRTSKAIKSVFLSYKNLILNINKNAHKCKNHESTIMTPKSTT
jgi:hypothetical protein